MKCPHGDGDLAVVRELHTQFAVEEKDGGMSAVPIAGTTTWVATCEHGFVMTAESMPELMDRVKAVTV